MTAAEFAAWSERRQLPRLVTAEQVDQLETYVRVLADWNVRLNLTGFSLSSDLEPALDRLVLEPVLAAEHVDASVRKLVDVGSGSGSPAIPLLIAAPWIELTMVESRQKKSVFLREAVRAIGMRAQVTTARLEDLPANSLPESFDAASLRGVRLDSDLGKALSKLLIAGAPLFYFDSTESGAPSLAGFRNASEATFQELPGFRVSVLSRL